jgi:hypothetical protein
MTTKSSRLLVVDASVARAAGKTEKPTSKASRETLTSILKICHRMIETPDIQVEWKKHASPFAILWRSAMLRKGKIKRVQPDTSDLDQELLELPTTKFVALKKDMRLIEAACEGDKVIITLDDKIVAIYKECCGKLQYPVIRWINPVQAFDEKPDWLWEL